MSENIINEFCSNSFDRDNFIRFLEGGFGNFERMQDCIISHNGGGVAAI